MFSSAIHKIKNNSFILKMVDSFLGKGAYSFFTILFSLVCTRLYGAEIFGEFTYAFTIVTILSIVAKAGLDSGLIYSLPKNKDKHVSFVFLTNLVISVILIAFVWLLADKEYLKFMIPLVWLYSVEALFFSLYRHEGKFKEYYRINGVFSLILRITLLIILYFIFGDNAYSVGIAVYASFIFSNIIYLSNHRGKFKKIFFDKHILVYSFPLVLSNMTSLLMGRIDILMIGNMGTAKDVGIYQIVIQLSGIISVLLVIFTSVFAPKIADLYHRGQIENVKLLYIKSTRILSMLSLTISFILIIFSEILLRLFGSEFLQGQLALIFMFIGQFINVAVGGVWTLMAMTGKPKFQMYSNFAALVINVILNILLIPRFGINGAAFANMITISFTNIVGYVVVKKQFGIKVFKFF